MKKSIILAIVALFVTCNIQAQVGLNVKKLKLGDIPTITAEEDSLYKKDGLFCATFEFAYDYFVNDENKFELWQMEHRVFKIYDETNAKDLETLDFGTIDPENIHIIQARVIKNGEVLKSYTKKDLEKKKDEDASEDDLPNIQIKFSGVEPGTIIEYLIVRKRSNIIEQDDIRLQHTYPVKNIQFTIVMPQHLKPYVQLYNGTYPIIDTIIDSKELRYTTIHIDYLPAIKKEVVSFYDKYMCRVEFNIAYNLAQSRLRMNTTKDFVNEFYDNIQLTDKEIIKILKKDFIKKIKFAKNASELDKINTIEHFMKDQLGGVNIGVVQLTRFYGYIFNHYKIKYQLVITCDKTEREFDKNFNGSNFYDNILFYFPTLNHYMAPAENSFRNGLIPINYAGNNGIFLQTVEVGKEKSFVHSFKKIPEGPADAGIDNLNLKFKIDPTNGTLIGTIERTMGSYRVHFIQAFFKAFEVEEKEQLIEMFLTLDAESSNISNEEFLNTDPKDVGVLPFIAKANISNTDWIKVNKSTIELSVGKMIGKQDRLEEKEIRQLPVEKEYLNSYIRVIVIDIPEGYKPLDLSKLAYGIYDTDDPENATAGFVCSYKLEGNTLTITVKEYYNKLFYPVSEYPQFKRVTNSAADFNDIKITLTKE
ncbi:MAG TPA: DUF3857 domain-containing protein [Bacteroidales bacterium]|nr:DUF3857 domain-containing protein [Bacteroidales bacterium]